MTEQGVVAMSERGENENGDDDTHTEGNTATAGLGFYILWFKEDFFSCRKTGNRQRRCARRATRGEAMRGPTFKMGVVERESRNG